MSIRLPVLMGKRLRKVVLRLRMQRSRSRGRTGRRGMGLAEMALAIAVASVFVLTTLQMVASGLRLRMEAERISLASTIGQAKMSQLMSRPVLDKTDEKGLIANEGPYAGFEYEIHVKEEKIDLAQIAAEGKVSPIKLDDKMEPGVQNGKPPERAGQSQATATGGLVDINRVILTVTYPMGEGRKGKYRIETFKSVSKTVQP